MNKIKICLTALLFAWSCTMTAQEELSLQQAIDLALQQNFQIQISRNEAEIATNSNHPGNAGMLPNISLNVNETPSLTNLNQRFTNGAEIVRNGVVSNTFSPNIALSYTLFDGGKMFATKEKLEELQAIGENNLKASIQNVVSNVVRAYYQVISQEQYMQVLLKLQSSSNTRIELVKARQEVGLANNSDLFLAQLDVDTRNQAVSAQEVAIANAHADLNALLNLPVMMVHKVSAADANDMVLNRADLDAAFQNNPEYVLADQRVKVALQTEKEAKAALYPRIGLSAAYSYSLSQSQAGFTLYNQVYGPTGTLSLSVPLFSGNVNSRNHKNALIQIENAQLQQKQTLTALTTSYEKAWQLYLNAGKQVEADKKSIATANEFMELMKQRYELGQSTVLEYREAQRTFEETNYRFITNQFLLKMAETDLLRLTGKLLK